MFKLKAPCSNCPFRKEGGIQLGRGRLRGIIETLLRDDWSNFQCHRTVHNEKTGGQWGEDGAYEPSGREAMCAGAAIFLEKAGRPTVGMRLARCTGDYHPSQYGETFDAVIDGLPEHAAGRSAG